MVTTDIEDEAKSAAGNWKEWGNFYWPSPPSWSDVAFHWEYATEAGGLVEKSNAAVIEDCLRPFVFTDRPDDEQTVLIGQGTHWCGGMTIYKSVIRVYDDEGRVTPAFRCAYDLAVALREEDILNPDHLCDMGCDACERAIREEYDGDTSSFPEGWDCDVRRWLSESLEWSGEIEDVDGHGAWPSRESIDAALAGLGLI